MTSSGILLVPSGPRDNATAGVADDAGLAEALFHDNARAMMVYDVATLRVMLVNRAAAAQYGYSETEFLSLTAEDLRPAEERERFKDFLANAPQVPLRTRNWRHRHKDGTVFTVDITTRPCTFRGRSCRLATADPVVQGRDRADALAAMELAIGAMNDGVVVTDAVGLPGEGPLVRLVNPAFERQTGWSAAEIIGRPRFSKLTYSGAKKISRLPKRSAIVAFSAEEVYAVAEMLRRPLLARGLVQDRYALRWYQDGVLVVPLRAERE